MAYFVEPMKENETIELTTKNDNAGCQVPKLKNKEQRKELVQMEKEKWV